MRSTVPPFAAPLIGDEQIADVVACLRSGWHTTGQNVKQFAEALAAFAVVKHAFHARRLQLARAYDEGFRDLAGVTTPSVEAPEDHGWHLYVIRVDARRAGIDRDAFIRELVARDSGVSVHFIPLHVQPYYRDRYGFQPGDFPNALQAYEQPLSLPICARMTEADAADVIAAVHETVGAVRP